MGQTYGIRKKRTPRQNYIVYRFTLNKRHSSLRTDPRSLLIRRRSRRKEGLDRRKRRSRRWNYAPIHPLQCLCSFGLIDSNTYLTSIVLEKRMALFSCTAFSRPGRTESIDKRLSRFYTTRSAAIKDFLRATPKTPVCYKAKSKTPCQDIVVCHLDDQIVTGANSLSHVV